MVHLHIIYKQVIILDEIQRKYLHLLSQDTEQNTE